MRTFVLLTRIAVHTSACRKSCESHTFFQSISSGLCTPFFSAVGCLGKENSYEGTVESVSVMELDEVIRDRSKHTLSKRVLPSGDAVMEWRPSFQKFLLNRWRDYAS